MRFFHGYYDCYCYLPLYVFCGRHLLDAKLRRASVDAADGAVEAVARIIAQIRCRWPAVRILVRAEVARATFMPPIEHQRLPAWLLERFAGDDADRLVALLRFIGPVTSASLLADWSR